METKIKTIGKYLTLMMVLSLCFGNIVKWETFLRQRQIGNKYVDLIRVDVGRHQVVASTSTKGGSSLKELVDKVWGQAGVNGAYFQPQDYGHTNNTTNADRIVNWEKDFSARWDFWARWMFGFKKDGTPLFIANNHWYVRGGVGKYNEDKVDEIYNGISNHPILLLEWENVLYRSSNLIDSKMKTKSAKTFICSRENKKTILMGTVYNVDVYEQVEYLRDTLNCYNAIALDSGGSRWMVYDNEYVNGKYWPIKNGRPIVDAFVVVNRWINKSQNTSQQSNHNNKQSTISKTQSTSSSTNTTILNKDKRYSEKAYKYADKFRNMIDKKIEKDYKYSAFKEQRKEKYTSEVRKILENGYKKTNNKLFKEISEIL